MKSNMYKYYLPLLIYLFNLQCFSLEEKPFVVLIASYNNQKYVKKNIESVLEQNYTNYRVIYIDDASKDQTLKSLIAILKEHPKKNLFSIYRNSKNVGAMQNHYTAIHSCKNEEIVVILDGDDWFYSQNTLDILNRYYQDENVWLTWGSYIDYPSMQKGQYGEEIPNEELLQANIRKSRWRTSHLRSFYAGLFKKIKKSDFLLNGQFFSAGCDLAEMIPMIEMARERVRFVPEILYVYNKLNPISDSKVHGDNLNQVKKQIGTLSVYPRINAF